ncbi:MAG: spore cortex biosynthesis protein YabQ [Bacillaceae bacterium]
MSLTTQFYAMLALVGMGTVIGISFDTYNRFLRRPKRWNFIVFGLDILFWIVQALASFFVMMKVNSGELRFYLYLALLLGYATYQALFKQLYIKVLEWIILSIVRVYRFSIRIGHFIFIKPIILLVTVVIAILTYIIKVCIRILQFIFTLIMKILFVFGKLIWFFVPKKLKNYLQKYKGIFSKVKNNLNIIGKIKTFLLKLKK